MKCLKEGEELDMKFDKEMDDAAFKIQKHYRNKKKKDPNQKEPGYFKL